MIADKEVVIKIKYEIMKFEVLFVRELFAMEYIDIDINDPYSFDIDQLQSEVNKRILKLSDSTTKAEIRAPFYWVLKNENMDTKSHSVFTFLCVSDISNYLCFMHRLIDPISIIHAWLICNKNSILKDSVEQYLSNKNIAKLDRITTIRIELDIIQYWLNKVRRTLADNGGFCTMLSAANKKSKLFAKNISFESDENADEMLPYLKIKCRLMTIFLKRCLRTNLRPSDIGNLGRFITVEIVDYTNHELYENNASEYEIQLADIAKNAVDICVNEVQPFSVSRYFMGNHMERGKPDTILIKTKNNSASVEYDINWLDDKAVTENKWLSMMIQATNGFSSFISKLSMMHGNLICVPEFDYASLEKHGHDEFYDNLSDQFEKDMQPIIDKLMDAELMTVDQGQYRDLDPYSDILRQVCMTHIA